VSAPELNRARRAGNVTQVTQRRGSRRCLRQRKEFGAREPIAMVSLATKRRNGIDFRCRNFGCGGGPFLAALLLPA
jgi:hypothetical protein